MADQPQKPPLSGTAKSHAERVAEQMRENLKKRKAQQRERTAPKAPPPSTESKT